MPTIRSRADVAAEIVRRNVPTLFIDTCAALDVVRCAARVQPRVAVIARELIGAHAAGELLLYGSSVLADEATRNRAEVEGDAKREARQVDEAIAAYRGAAGAVAHPYPHTAAFEHENLVGPLIALHDQLLAACVRVADDPALGSVALKRAGSRRRPARGGGGANDCLMFEEFRHLALEAHDADPFILLTTNTKDFAEQGVVHPDLTSDLVGTRARVCLAWPEVAAAVLSRDRLRSTAP